MHHCEFMAHGSHASANSLSELPFFKPIRLHLRTHFSLNRSAIAPSSQLSCTTQVRRNEAKGLAKEAGDMGLNVDLLPVTADDAQEAKQVVFHPDRNGFEQSRQLKR